MALAMHESVSGVEVVGMVTTDPTLRIADDVILGKNVKLPGFANL